MNVLRCNVLENQHSNITAVECLVGAAAAQEMPLYRDVSTYGGREVPLLKRAQIAASDVGTFDDLDQLTIFADNVVPHVLRVDGVLRYRPELAARIDAGELLEAGSAEEVEIRACAVHAGELLAARLGVAPRTLDGWLWNRGQAPRYKAIPRHRARSVYY